jgi:hypothetical protein
MPRPSHSSRFHHLRNSGRGVQILKLLIMKFCPLLCYLVFLGPNILPNIFILKHPRPTFFHQCERPRFTPIQNKYYISKCLEMIQFLGITNKFTSNSSLKFRNINLDTLINKIHTRVQFRLVSSYSSMNETQVSYKQTFFSSCYLS